MEKKNKKGELSEKTLTVEDLIRVVGGADKGGGGTSDPGGEIKYTQREGRYPPVKGNF